MHIPDGFFDATTSLGAGAVAAGGVAVAARRTARDLDDRAVPLAGLVAAFLFAAQMLSVPIAAGTSGHLLGGVLAAVLVGPWAGVLCVTVVLAVQTLFADGGLTALGLNVVNLALVGSLLGYALFAALRVVFPHTRRGVALASGLAAAASVVASAAAFSVEYALGGAGGASPAAVAAAMVGVHTLIGAGEGVATALAVGALLEVRPDLVRGARGVVDAGLAPRPVGAGAEA